MKPLCCAAVLCLAAVPMVAAPAPKTTMSKQKIVGIWEMTKWNGKAPSSRVAMEFTKDGKMTVTVRVDGRTLGVAGTYFLDGNKLKRTLEGPTSRKKSGTDTITKLTDTELHLTDEKGEKTEFKRKR